MKYLIYLVLPLLCSVASPSEPLAAVGDVNYISDVLSVPLRSGPSSAHRIVHRGLSSGTRLTILAVDEEAGFSHVRTDGETEGWLRTQYLIAEPIARAKLTTAERRLKNIKEKINNERKTREKIQTEFKEMTAKNKTLTTRGDALAKELAELKRISADAINMHDRNVALTQQNEILTAEVSELSATAKQLKEDVERDYLMVGGGLVLLGLLIGVMLKSRPQRSSYSRYK